MADCPYARCIQERRHIRRELLRWTKNMVFVVGLERVAEELMGRRKWKQYQDTLYSSTRSESATQPHHRLYPTLSTTCSLGTGSVSQVGHRQASSGLAQSTTPPLTAATPEPIVAKQPQQINNHKAEDECRVKLEPIDDTKSIGLSLTALSGRRRPRRGDADDEEENGHSDPEILEKRLKLDEEAQQITLIINENDKCVKEEPAETQEIKEEPQEENCGEEVPKSNSNKSTKESEVCSTVAFTVHRRVSPPPEDWKPLDKCYLCLDGKLPHDDQPPLSPQSESSSSSRSAESPMSVQVDPMAASVVAAALSGTYPTLLPQWGLHARETALAGVQGHQESGPSVDQPLDLSAKPKNSQDNNISMMEQQKIPLRMPTGMDPKSIFTSSYRAKPRLTGPGGVGGVPVPGGGRRTYTEEELQAALRDIQSGKLGTRRAAVIYGIPRSTLRNKVYKLALERERDASLTSTQSHPHDSGAPASTTITTTTTSTTTTTPNTTQNASTTTPPPQVDEADDRELSGAEEEKEVEKALLRPLLSLEDLVRFSALEPGGGDALRSLLQRGQETGTEWPGFEHANIGPYIQKMLAAAAPFKGLETQDYRIPEVMRRLMSEDKRLNKSVNGDQGQAHTSHQQTSTPSLQQRVPMTNDDFNPSIEEEASDSGQGRAILKIPSYKPASTPGSSKNNGEPNSAAFAQSFAATSSATTASPGLLERASPVFSGTSSPTNSLVGKTVGVNFRDVIAKSISSKFQESQSSLPNQTAMSGQNTQAGMISDSNLFKRGRYTPPQPQSQGASSQQATKSSSSSSSQDKNKAPGSGGKGTRPKRGKYRNYDRDSLVEAVRAVQRGEMSVHRAGSYFGVPHSTLEYKVKERHLMRPRKRDQKPPEDKAKETPATSTSMRPGGMQDKKSTLKPQKPFTPGAGTMPGPNGLKMPPFLEGMPHLPFPHPFNFWSPTPFMPSPFIPGAPNVPTMLPEQYFATQRMRGLQEQQRSAIVQPQHQQRDRDSIAPSAEQPGTSNSRSSKQAMDVSDGAYDASDANGSLLDILIRSRLDTNISRDQRAPMTEGRSQSTAHHDSMSSKALIDQLCRNSRRTPLPRMTQDSSEDESYRGPSSRSLPDRPERVPTVDLSPSPDRPRPDDGCERLTSPATPLSRTASRDEDSRPDRESEIHNGGQQDDRKGLSLQPQLNHYADIHYSVTEKKSACDSKLIVDQKTQQQELAAVSGLVVQLQRGYNTGANNRTSEQIQLNSQSTSQPVPESRSAVLTMEDSVE